MPTVNGSGPGAGAIGDVSIDSTGKSTQPHLPRYNPDGSGGPGPKYLRTEALLDRRGSGLADRMIVAFAEKLLGLDTLNDICLKAGAPWPSSKVMIDHLFSELNINWRVTNPGALEAIADKQAVFVANHPYGMPDAFAMNNLLEEANRDFRMFANSFMASADSITHKLLFVDPFMNEKNRAMNRRSMMLAMKHLKEGGDLALFPGRICSHLKWGQRHVQDDEWTDQIRSFLDAGKANLVPIHVSGRNSWIFQAAGLIHPRLRTLLILREFKRGGHEIDFTIGEPVSHHHIVKAARVAPVGQLARALTYATNPAHAPLDKMQPVAVRVAAPQKRGAMKKASTGKRSLATERVLSDFPVRVEHGDFEVRDVYHGLPAELEAEVAQVRHDAYGGEGDIRSAADMIDGYDRLYSHLVLWDRNKKEIAGSYRYIIPARVEDGLEPSDLVTGSIFELRQPFIDLLPQALEVGRAAISNQYQRSYAPLMMMWRGITDIMYRDSSIRYVIGPVTISQSFSALSRHVLKRFLECKCMNRALYDAARPYHEFNAAVAPEVDIDELVENANSLTDIACIIEALEGGRRKLPVLYRQYSNMGLKYVATGEWPELGNAMASLAVLDMSEAKPDFFARYLGKDRVARFLAERGMVSAA